MASIVSFTFNPFYENTYVIYDETGECVVVDPGCYTKEEQEELGDFITKQRLKPKYLINTHCHIDHVLGNKFVADTWRVPLLMHKGELNGLHEVVNYAPTMGMNYKPSPEPEIFVEDGDKVTFGNTILDVIFAPGHSAASICFYCKAHKFIVSGDVLFRRSIGRTDLPGGNYETLINSINEKLLPLPDETKVYAGHMQPTTIGEERSENPFLK
jgi:hydroxyacylglutathione hydrolase